MIKEIEKIKIKERLEFAFDYLKAKKEKEKLTISDDVFFTQACELGRMLFVRSEISYSGRKA